MKAKEYAKKYQLLLWENNTERITALAKICSEMSGEIRTIAVQRRVDTDAGLLSIMHEIHLKWKAFLRLIGESGLNDNLFAVIMEKDIIKHPGLSAWIINPEGKYKELNASRNFRRLLSSEFQKL